MCCNLASAKAIWHDNLAVSKVVSISRQDYRVQRKEHVSYHTFHPEELILSRRASRFNQKNGCGIFSANERKPTSHCRPFMDTCPVPKLACMFSRSSKIRMPNVPDYHIVPFCTILEQLLWLTHSWHIYLACLPIWSHNVIPLPYSQSSRSHSQRVCQQWSKVYLKINSKTIFYSYILSGDVQHLHWKAL